MLVKEDFYISQEEGYTMPCRTTGDTRLWPGGKRSKGKVSILSGVSKRKAVQGRVDSSRLVSMNNSSGPRGTGLSLVVWDLVRGNTGLLCGSLSGRWRGVWTMDWLFSYERRTGEWGALCSKNWLDVGGAVSPQSGRPQMPGYQE